MGLDTSPPGYGWLCPKESHKVSLYYHTTSRVNIQWRLHGPYSPWEASVLVRCYHLDTNYSHLGNLFHQKGLWAFLVFI